MSGYFYITCKKDVNVLDCDTWDRPTALTALTTKERKAHRDTQLWKWDSEGRLVNKADNSLVADVKQENKAPGTPVILWSATGNANQIWRVEDDIIKSGLNDLALVGGSRVTMGTVSNSAAHKWEFVPESLWDEFKVTLETGNPVKNAAFWTMVAEGYIHVIVGYNIDEYEREIPMAIATINQCADNLDKVASGTGIARTTGGAVGIAGGAAFLGGLALAPFTAGASLALTVAGVTAGVTGGLTTLSSGIAKLALDKENVQKVKKAVGPLFNATMCLHGFMSRYIEKLKAARQYLETEEGRNFAREIREKKTSRRGWLKIAVPFWTDSEPDRTEQVKAVVRIVEDNYFALGGVKLGVTVASVAPRAMAGSSVGAARALVSVGSTSARVLSGSLAVFGVAIGIWDVVGGALDIKNGSDLAREFRITAHKLKEESSAMIAHFRQISSNPAKKDINQPDY